MGNARVSAEAGEHLNYTEFVGLFKRERHAIESEGYRALSAEELLSRAEPRRGLRTSRARRRSASERPIPSERSPLSEEQLQETVISPITGRPVQLGELVNQEAADAGNR